MTQSSYNFDRWPLRCQPSKSNVTNRGIVWFKNGEYSLRKRKQFSYSGKQLFYMTKQQNKRVITNAWSVEGERKSWHAGVRTYKDNFIYEWATTTYSSVEVTDFIYSHLFHFKVFHHSTSFCMGIAV